MPASKTTKTLKKQFIIEDLLQLGVTHYHGVPVQELDYETAKHVLVMAKIQRGI